MHGPGHPAASRVLLLRLRRWPAGCWSPGGPVTSAPFPASGPTPAAVIRRRARSLADAARRRLGFELGLQVSGMRMVLPDFSYRASDGRIEENEFCPVLVCRVNGEPSARPDEVDLTEWWSWDEFLDAAADPDSGLSPWARCRRRCWTRPSSAGQRDRAAATALAAGVHQPARSARAISSSRVTVFQFRTVTLGGQAAVPVDLAEGGLRQPVRAPQVQVIADDPARRGAFGVLASSSGVDRPSGRLGEEAEKVLRAVGRRSSRRGRPSIAAASCVGGADDDIGRSRRGCSAMPSSTAATDPPGSRSVTHDDVAAVQMGADVVDTRPRSTPPGARPSEPSWPVPTLMPRMKRR